MSFNTKDAIDKLEEVGFRVHVRHERPVADWYDGRFEYTGLYMTKAELDASRGNGTTTNDARFEDKGGTTVVTIDDVIAGGDLFVEGVAYCRPDDDRGPGDQFNRKLGTRIALGRALKQLPSVEVRS